MSKHLKLFSALLVLMVLAPISVFIFPSNAEAARSLVENSWRYEDGQLVAEDASSEEDGIALLSMDILPDGATAQGIDVSEHQGRIDWNAVKASGIDFAILRVGFGAPSWGGRVDYQFNRNISECERLGIPYGVYIYSYDSGIIAYSLLVFACLMRGFFGEQKSIGCKEIVIYLIISAFLAPCKVVYSGMILLGLLVPLSQFQDVKVGRIGKCILIFAVIASVLVLRIASMSTLVSQSSDASRGQEIGRFYTLSDIIMHPKNSFEVFFRTLDSLGDFYWGSTLGYSLGWLQKNLQFPAFFMIPYLLFGFICCLDSEDEPSFLSPICSILFIIAFALAALGSIVSMWLGWTFNYENVIQGVQGRYFLPVLPALLFGSRTRLFKFNSSSLSVVSFGMCVMNCLYLIRFISIASCV